jgi:hypothetical protein
MAVARAREGDEERELDEQRGRTKSRCHPADPIPAQFLVQRGAWSSVEEQGFDGVERHRRRDRGRERPTDARRASEIAIAGHDRVGRRERRWEREARGTAPLIVRCEREPPPEQPLPFGDEREIRDFTGYRRFDDQRPSVEPCSERSRYDPEAKRRLSAATRIADAKRDTEGVLLRLQSKASATGCVCRHARRSRTAAGRAQLDVGAADRRLTAPHLRDQLFLEGHRQGPARRRHPHG